jgi:DnaJ-class molecular chaperone
MVKVTAGTVNLRIYHILVDPFTANMYKMVGTSVENRNGSGGLRNTKSYKFAGKLSGRFFVSGISGGFDKHKQQQQKGESVAHSKVALFSYGEIRKGN